MGKISHIFLIPILVHPRVREIASRPIDCPRQSAATPKSLRLLFPKLLVVGLLCSAGWLAGAVAYAQERKGDGRMPSPPGAAVYFVDLKDGAVVKPTFTVRFGLRNMGVAPAGSERDNSGHHHLLVDTDLQHLQHEIPNDPNHLHFGGGQTEAEVTLAPGPHTLQLVLGDKDHIPHDPPVVSERIQITVVEDKPQVAAPSAAAAPPAQIRKQAPPDARVYFIYPANGDYIYPRSTIRFGLSNMGVAPAGIAKAFTGHHHLLLDTEVPPLNQEVPNDPNHLHLGGGQTELKLMLSPGRHTLQLLLADENHVPHDPPVISERITVTVHPRGPNAKR